jgi:hypothetical protein
MSAKAEQEPFGYDGLMPKAPMAAFELPVTTAASAWPLVEAIWVTGVDRGSYLSNFECVLGRVWRLKQGVAEVIWLIFRKPIEFLHSLMCR